MEPCGSPEPTSHIRSSIERVQPFCKHRGRAYLRISIIAGPQGPVKLCIAAVFSIPRDLYLWRQAGFKRNHQAILSPQTPMGAPASFGLKVQRFRLNLFCLTRACGRGSIMTRSFTDDTIVLSEICFDGRPKPRAELTRRLGLESPLSFSGWLRMSRSYACTPYIWPMLDSAIFMTGLTVCRGYRRTPPGAVLLPSFFCIITQFSPRCRQHA